MLVPLIQLHSSLWEGYSLSSESLPAGFRRSARRRIRWNPCGLNRLKVEGWEPVAGCRLLVGFCSIVTDLSFHRAIVAPD